MTPLFSRRHYEWLAAFFYCNNSFFSDTQGKTVKAIVVCKLADKLASDNSRFDRNRFLKACGIEP